MGTQTSPQPLSTKHSKSHQNSPDGQIAAQVRGKKMWKWYISFSEWWQEHSLWHTHTRTHTFLIHISSEEPSGEWPKFTPKFSVHHLKSLHLKSLFFPPKEPETLVFYVGLKISLKAHCVTFSRNLLAWNGTVNTSVTKIKQLLFIC